MYCLQFEDGTYVGRQNDRLIKTNSFSKAIKYRERTKIQNISEHFPKRLQTEGKVSIKDLDESEREIHRLGPFNQTENDVIIKRIAQLLIEIENCFQELEDITILRKNLSEIDLQMNDIDHYLEFCSFSASEGYKLSKARKDLRITRRKCKNKIKAWEIVNNGNLPKNISKARKDFQDLLNQTYEPKKLIELFERKIK